MWAGRQRGGFHFFAPSNKRGSINKIAGCLYGSRFGRLGSLPMEIREPKLPLQLWKHVMSLMGGGEISAIGDADCGLKRKNCVSFICLV